MSTRRRAQGSAPCTVLHVSHVARLSGGEIALERMVAALGPAAASSVLLFEDGPLRARLEARGVEVLVLEMDAASRDLRREQALGPRSVMGLLRQVRQIGALLRGRRPDIVHAHSLKAGLCAGIACRLTGVPMVWHVHDRIAADYLPAAYARALRAGIRVLPAAVVTNSETTRRTLGPRTRAVAIPNPIELPALSSNGAAGPVRRVGLVGRFAPWKGQDLFVRAFARAFPDSGEEAVLVGTAMFGEDDYERRVHDEVGRLGLGDRVRFRGFSDDVPAELRELDLLVHASVLPEPFGQVVLEGMAAGVPVVAADAGGPAEVITDGEDGILYPMGSEQGLAAAMRRVADDAALREQLREGGRRRAGAFAPDVVARSLLAVYDGVLARRR